MEDGANIFWGCVLPLDMMILRTLVVMVVGLGALGAGARPLNVVFILADDLGQRDLGCYGSTYDETPNLDALARSGVRFTDAYAACNVCSPSRAALLTGKYPARLHLTDWLPGRKEKATDKVVHPPIINHLPKDEVTVGQAFKEAGYATAFMGKWHLGGPKFYPEHFGFDVNVGGCQLGHPPSYFSPYKIPTLPDGPKGEYLTDRLTNEACAFIEKNKERPFLLYFSEYAVHNPQQAKAEDVEKFKAKSAAHPPDGPEIVEDLGRKVRRVQNVPVYAANLYALDQSVGRVMAKLKELGLEENTVVIFTSDNGGLSTAEGMPTSNFPLRGGKGWNYEGGVREPFIVKWPGVTKGGTTCDGVTIGMDLYPTLLEMAGLPARPQQHVDGVSIVPLLKGEKMAERALFWHYPHYSNQGGGPSAAMRRGDWKLMESLEDEHVELYNLRSEVGEKANLASSMPEKTAQMLGQLHGWQKSVDAGFPTPNPNYKPAR
jgi:arylsulfatase A-like enzyme